MRKTDTRTLSKHETATPRNDARGPHDPDLALRNRTLARTAVSEAQGILTQRYRLPSQETAFELLRLASQRHNIKLHTLADAVTRVPGPDHDAALWFPGRARTSAPPLTRILPSDQRSSSATQGQVLSATLKRVLEITETGMGNVQLAERGLLRLEKHTGLNRRFTDFFTFVDHSSTACAQAAENREQVTVHDVATAPVFDAESRHVILQADSRACHSIPLVGHRGALLGVISSHHRHPLSGFTRAQLNSLQSTATDAGHWLSWHRRTIVLDALEHLHTAARQMT
ncbi:GAF and ANTAR domain-containing protein [Streptomyces sp. NPDC007206]|uniref:GAF and ANTAR domain-containing protein n=1 Tax=Streptomyces sp. NPDC007206 TaxID=3154317 RepID=UPI0033F62B54